jgi:hypothetical protein
LKCLNGMRPFPAAWPLAPEHRDGTSMPGIKSA